MNFSFFVNTDQHVLTSCFKYIWIQLTNWDIILLQFFSVNYVDYISTIEPPSCTNFPICYNQVHAILKVLNLDYALNEEKPHAPSPIYDYYIERMKEYTPKLEKWEKSDRIAKMMIRYSISFDMRSFFPTKKDNKEFKC